MFDESRVGQCRFHVDSVDPHYEKSLGLSIANAGPRKSLFPHPDTGTQLLAGGRPNLLGELSERRGFVRFAFVHGPSRSYPD
jgi:hypothetical protein